MFSEKSGQIPPNKSKKVSSPLKKGVLFMRISGFSKWFSGFTTDFTVFYIQSREKVNHIVNIYSLVHSSTIGGMSLIAKVTYVGIKTTISPW